jgi:nitrogen fixation NifU-like protein
MSFYREKILDHYRNPRNAGVLENADCAAHQDNPLCGDIVDIFVKVKDNKIEDARFEGEGCAISIAATSMLLEKVKGMSRNAVLKMSENDITSLLGMPLTISRAKCGTLGLIALQSALKKYGIQRKTKNSRS